MQVHWSRKQKAWTYALAGISVLLGPLGIDNTWATLFPFGVSPSKGTRSLPASCQASDRTSGGISELIAKATSVPSGASYDELGRAFTEQNKLPCAITAYEVALDFDPGRWRTRYALAL